MVDLVAHLTRQAAFGRATFGPGHRTEGVLKHIETEIEEVRKAYAADDLDELVKEWTDIAILGLDGLIRAVRNREEVRNNARRVQAEERFKNSSLPIELIHGEFNVLPFITHDQVAKIAADSIVGKQGKNELRDWPDWRVMADDQPIEHDRSQGVQ